MTLQPKLIKPVIWEIDGYMRKMRETMRPQVVPLEINQIVYMFYDMVLIHSLSMIICLI